MEFVAEISTNPLIAFLYNEMVSRLQKEGHSVLVLFFFRGSKQGTPSKMYDIKLCLKVSLPFASARQELSFDIFLASRDVGNRFTF